MGHNWRYLAVDCEQWVNSFGPPNGRFARENYLIFNFDRLADKSQITNWKLPALGKPQNR